MKSLRDYSMNMPEKDYHAFPAWSYSQIARYAREGFGAVQTIHDPVPQTPAMQFGSLFDCMLTRGEGEALRQYAVLDDVPTGQEKVVWDYVYEHGDGRIPGNKEIMDAVNATGYHQSGKAKWGEDACMSHLEPYRGYYNALASGRDIVSNTDWHDAREMVKAIKSNPLTAGIFSQDSDDVEYIYQAQFKETMFLDEGMLNDDAVPVKIMPDLLIVDHRHRTVRPVDLKTSGVPSREFAQHWVKMRYDIQAHLYSDVLRGVLDRDVNLAKYVILPYFFVDVSRTDMIPLVFEYDQDDVMQMNGLSVTTGDRTYNYKNWRTLLREIIGYEESRAVVPSYLSTDKVNDLLKAINETR